MHQAAGNGHAQEKGRRSDADPFSYQIRTASGTCRVHGSDAPMFTVDVPDDRYWEWLSRASAYHVGLAFVQGDFRVEGDLIQALRWWRESRSAGSQEWMLRALGHLRIEPHLQSWGRARHNIRFHYDRSNDFYRQFLDRRMVYSCAYFENPSWSIDDAQVAKLDHICGKLNVRAGTRFLDVGCGWGALVVRAAEEWQASATGCTLSRAQYAHAIAAVQGAGLTGRATIRECDYREMDGRFDAVASVGMFEHVGRHRLAEYFATIARLLDDGGVFLNHGIVRPSSVHEDSSTVFLRRRVFPGGELPSLGEVVVAAEGAGFEVLDVENLRPHYALTCAAWVDRLRRNEAACLAAVDPETYRTWMLYLAGACVSFERGEIELHQVLLGKRSAASTRPTSRRYMYSEQPPAWLRFSRTGVERQPAARDCPAHASPAVSACSS